MLRPTIISIDESKKQISGYAPNKAEEFHEESAKLANKSFDSALKSSSDGEVILMCGGSASGKTEFLSVYLNNFRGIIFDSTMPTTQGAEIKIKKIIKAKKKPIICAIFPDDIKRAFVAFLGRDRKFSDEYFYKTHSGSRSTLLWVLENYPQAEIRIYESSYQKDSLIFKEIIFQKEKERVEFLKKNQYTESDILNLVKAL